VGSLLTARAAFFGLPSAPSNLVGTPTGPNQVLLAWQDNSADEDGFQVWRRPAADSTFVKVGGDLPPNATSLTDNAVSPSAAYVYKVRAKNAEGASAFSNVVAVAAFDLPPAAPTNLTAVKVSGSESEIDLSWTDDASNETGFEVARIPAVINGSWETVASLPADSIGYRDLSSEAGTGYSYKVFAVNYGNGVASNTASITLPPAKPTGSAASAVSDGEVRLVWSDVAGETGYDVRYKKTSDSTWTTVAAPENATGYTASALVPGTSYDLAVRAKNSGGNSVYTGTKTASTTTLITPTGLTATALSSTKIKLQWTDNSKAENGYKVERKTGETGTFAQIQTTAANATSYEDTGLSATTNYYYRVRASQTSGDSGYSSEANATTQALPYLVEVAVNEDCLIAGGTTTATVRLSGPAPTDQTVSLSRSRSLLTVPATVVVPADSSEATFTVTVGTAAEPSSASLYATLGNWMQKAKISSVPSAEIDVPNLTATPISGGVQVSWDGIAEDIYGQSVAGYHVYRSPDNVAYTRLTSAPVPAASYVDVTAQSNVTYYYRVDLCSGHGDAIAQSNAIVAINSSASSGISWNSPPTQTVSGTVQLSATRPSGDQQTYQLLVDGMPYASTLPASGDTIFGSTIDVSLNTTRLTNGTHTLLLVSTEGQAKASPSLSLTVSNGFAILSNDGIAEIGSSDFPSLSVSLATPSSFTVEIKDESGNVVRSWSGTGDKAQVVWDGKNNAGSTVADGRYIAQFSGNGASTDPEYLYKVGVAPEFLAICTIFDQHGLLMNSCSLDYSSDVATSIMSRSNYGLDYSFFVLTVDEKQSISPTFAKQLRKWLRSTVKYLYIYSHGTVRPGGTDDRHYALIGADLKIANYSTGGSSIDPRLWIDVGVERGTRRYKFAWIDTCGALGSDTDATGVNADEWGSEMTQTPNTRWFSALGVDTTPGYYEGFFMGFNGYMYMSTYGLVSSGHGQAFRGWREYWWQAFRAGNNAADCTIYAMGHLSFTATNPNPNS
jgi:hypothetical protein